VLISEIRHAGTAISSAVADEEPTGIVEQRGGPLLQIARRLNSFDVRLCPRQSLGPVHAFDALALPVHYLTM
jgi:hypothetical protein